MKPDKNTKQLVATFVQMRRVMDDLIEQVQEAEATLKALSERDGLDFSPAAIMKMTEGVWLQADTKAALDARKKIQREFIAYNEKYVKVRDEMAAIGILDPRPSKRH